jgi:hypothetical protein
VNRLTEGADDVAEDRADAVDQAWSDLDAAVDDLDGDDTVPEAVDSLRDEASQVATAREGFRRRPRPLTGRLADPRSMLVRPSLRVAMRCRSSGRRPSHRPSERLRGGLVDGDVAMKAVLHQDEERVVDVAPASGHEAADGLVDGGVAFHLRLEQYPHLPVVTAVVCTRAGCCHRVPCSRSAVASSWTHRSIRMTSSRVHAAGRPL